MRCLIDTINKQFKDMKVVYFLDGSDTTPTDVKDFISTGSTMLDLRISNRPDGGILVGRITELNGLESSGKSLIGGPHVVGDSEKRWCHCLHRYRDHCQYRVLRNIGLDVESMLYLHLETVEDIFSIIEEIVVKVRESDKDRLVTILVDSLSSSTKVELMEFDKDGWTFLNIILSKMMRKITQMIGRQKISCIYKST